MLLIGIWFWVQSSNFWQSFAPWTSKNSSYLQFLFIFFTKIFKVGGHKFLSNNSCFPFLHSFIQKSRTFINDIFSLNLARSPVFSHLSASLQGLHTIRALRVQEKFCEEFDNHQNLHTESWFLFLSSSRWLAVRLDWMCAIFITVVSFACVFLAKGLFQTWNYPWFDCYLYTGT